MKKLILILCFVLSIIMPAISQTFNYQKPEGTYYFTDTNGEKYKLVINTPKGGSAVAQGTVQLMAINKSNTIYYGSYDGIGEISFSISFSEPTPLTYGTLYISHDSWIYPSSERMNAENPKNRIKLSRGSSGGTKSASAKTSQRKKR